MAEWAGIAITLPPDAVDDHKLIVDYLESLGFKASPIEFCDWYRASDGAQFTIYPCEEPPAPEM